MTTKRPLWESLLIGMIYGFVFAVLLSLAEIYIDKTYVFSWIQAIFYFLCYSIFHTFTNRWKINKNQ